MSKIIIKPLTSWRNECKKKLIQFYIEKITYKNSFITFLKKTYTYNYYGGFCIHKWVNEDLSIEEINQLAEDLRHREFKR